MSEAPLPQDEAVARSYILTERSKDALSTTGHSAPRVGLSDEETLAVQQWLTAPFDVKAHLRQEHGWTDGTFRADDCRNPIELTAHHRRIHASEAYLGRTASAEGGR